MIQFKTWDWKLKRGGYAVIDLKLEWSWAFNLEFDLSPYVYFAFELFGMRIAFCWWGDD